eukprot:TRINITY_DN11539_c0_g1_i1.p1 TRINITY_DN11539_c0_g1~~TRINITY_DN11539_c0_g1_i1.p1  ORF type:complete len:189 (-),score=34.64 TRINITY_DN11539_c0_g1_i1:81-647(-)
MDGLQYLLKAPSQKAVEDLFLLSFQNRNSRITPQERKSTAQALEISEEESQQLLESINHVLSESLYESLAPESIVEILPDALNQKLKILIAKIITHHLPNWRKEAIATQVALPRLQAVDWRLDLKNSCDQAPRISGPALFVQLKVEQPRLNVKDEPKSENVIFELNKATLETMLEGFGQIRDKLNEIQ